MPAPEWKDIIGKRYRARLANGTMEFVVVVRYPISPVVVVRDSSGREWRCFRESLLDIDEESDNNITNTIRESNENSG